MDDNSSCHRSRTVKDFLAENNIPQMELPAVHKIVVSIYTVKNSDFYFDVKLSIYTDIPFFLHAIYRCFV